MKENIRQLLHHWSIEVTPRLAAELGDMRGYLPAGTKVYITFLPNGDFADSLRTCRALLAQGMIPVPHMALRNFPATLPIRDALMQVADAGVRDVLLIAGGSRHARQTPDNVPALLMEDWFAALPFDSVGFAAHPEGNQGVTEDALRAAEQAKYAYAQQHGGYYYFLTQFCFTPRPLLDWMQGLQARGHALPVHVGIPGLASRKSLIRHARYCGIGASAQYLRRNLMNWRHFFSPQQPDNLLYALAQAQHDDAHIPLRQLHFYPLSAFPATLAWIRAIEENRFTLTAQGFKTHV